MKSNEQQTASKATGKALEDFNDHTGFDDGELNGWLIGQAFPTATVVSLPETQEYFLYGNSWERREGTILSKQVAGLEPGKTYRISYRAKKSENLGNNSFNPRVAVRVAGVDVIPATVFGRPNVWATYTGTFEAPAASVAVAFESLTKNANGQELPNEGYGNFHIDDILVYDKYRDLTDFNDFTTGRWTPGEVAETARFVDEQGEHQVIWSFYTPGNDVHQGIIAQRTFTDLVPGRTYRFSVDARRDTNSIAPSLSLEITGQADGDRISPPLQTWRTYSRTFVATGNVELSIVSHVDTANGNDYSLDNLLVAEEATTG